MNFKINKLTTLVLIFALMLTSLFTLTSFAETTVSYPEKTIIIELDSDGKSTGTPENWSYDGDINTLTLNKGHSFAVNGECTAIVKNLGTIEGGTFKNKVLNTGDGLPQNNMGVINGGVFDDEVENGDTWDACTVNNGTFNGKFTNKNHGIVNNGVFNGECEFVFGSTVNNGTFNNTVTNNGTVCDGKFNKDFVNSGTIKGGTFALTFELNGGEWTSGYTAPKTYTYGSELVLPTVGNVSKGDLAFDGWYAEPDFSGVTLTTIPKNAGGSLKYYACFLEPSKINTWKNAGEKAQKDTDYTVDENGNYSVLTAKGLAKIANIVNDGDDLQGKIVTLVNDIDMLEGGVEGYGESTIVLRNSWIPISSFGGTFDGNNKKISNLYIYTNNTNAGLFNSNYGTVKNLEIASGKISAMLQNGNVGSICASNTGTVENCVNRVDIYVDVSSANSEICIGGISGALMTTTTEGYVKKIDNCENYGNIRSVGTSSTGVIMGGIVGGQGGVSVAVGNRMVLTDNCVNNGDLSLETTGYGSRWAGGIAGRLCGRENDNAEIRNCKNTGYVGAEHSGGILGCNYKCTYVYNCYNIGEIKGGTNAGGIVGLTYTYSTVNVANCYNIGTVSGATNNGEIVGKAQRGNIKYCYYLNNKNELCGYINSSRVTPENCYSFTSQNKVHTLSSEVYETTDLLTALKMWAKEKNDSGYLSWIANEQNDNYPQFLQKIQVKASINTAKETYFTVDFDTALENLKSENFAVTDGENEIALTEITASEDNKSYTLSGNFEVGKRYTVTIKYVSETHKISNEKLTFTVASTPTTTTTSGTSRYTVRFVTNGGNSVSSQKVLRKNTVKEPAEPTKKDCIFEGWYSDKELTEKYDFSEKVLGNITLYAKWSKAEKEKMENNKIILTINEKKVVLFGKKVENDAAPVIRNDRAMLPSRFVAESLGATVQWNEKSQQVTITKDDITIVITIGSDDALVNGEEITIDSPAFIENDRTYTPIRFVSEELGATVEWNENDQTVTITK